MKYITGRLKYGKLNTFTEHDSFGKAKREFDKLVEHYKTGIKPSINGVEIRDESQDTVLRWMRESDDEVAIKFGYKIHGLKTANGETRSANTQKFYETEADALDAARGFVQRQHNVDSIVIYKAVKMVRPTAPPVEVVDLATGEVE